MSLETQVRRYRPSDKNPLWRVHDEALRASALDFSPEYNRYLRHVESQFLDVGGEFLVAEVSADEHEETSLENIVAIGGYQPFGVLDASDRGPVDVPTDEAVRVRSVGVKPELQSQGVGTALMSELEARAADAEFRHVVLQSTASLERSHGFYESIDYRRAGTTNGEDAVWFHKRVGNG